MPISEDNQTLLFLPIWYNHNLLSYEHYHLLYKDTNAPTTNSKPNNPKFKGLNFFNIPPSNIYKIAATPKHRIVNIIPIIIYFKLLSFH